jgi:hypothetical protein
MEAISLSTMSSLIDNLAKHLPKPPPAEFKVSYRAQSYPYYKDLDRPYDVRKIAIPRTMTGLLSPAMSNPYLDKPTELTVVSSVVTPNVIVGAVWHDEEEGVLKVWTINGWLQLL